MGTNFLGGGGDVLTSFELFNICFWDLDQLISVDPLKLSVRDIGKFLFMLSSPLLFKKKKAKKAGI